MNEKEFLEKANEIVHRMYDEHPSASYQKAFMDGWYAFQTLACEHIDVFADMFDVDSNNDNLEEEIVKVLNEA